MKARFFLSYARSDGTNACEYFEQTLKNLGHVVYRDLTGNHGGDLWQERIRGEIRSADAFVLFVTPDSIASPNVEKEWREALALRKRIVPLMVLSAQVPQEILDLYHYRDVRDTRVLNLEPSLVVQTIETERQRISDRITGLRDEAAQDVADAARRRYLDPLWTELDRLFVRPQPALFPEEVFNAFTFLAGNLVTTLSKNEEIASAVDEMIAGNFQVPGWDLQPVYAAWPEAFARALKKVREVMPRITIPVVIVAMTKQEADDLESGAAFGTWPSQLKDEFDSLAPKLDPGWTARYGATPEDWKPFKTEAVSELIRKTFKLVEQDKCRLPLEPTFIDIRTLRKNRRQLRQLRTGPCLVVMDCISSRHPLLYSAFRASYLDLSQHAIVVRTLADSTFPPQTTSVELLVREWLDCEFYYRAREDDDPACADVAAWDDFRKLLRNQIPRCIPDCASQGNPAAERWESMNNMGRPG
jgi:hypothetical protein